MPGDTRVRVQEGCPYRNRLEERNGYWLPVLYTQPELLLMLTVTLKPRLHDTTSCQTGCNRLSNQLYNRFDNQLYRVNKHPTGCQSGCQKGLTTVCIVYTNI